jgi:hypothetical protein
MHLPWNSMPRPKQRDGAHWLKRLNSEPIHSHVKMIAGEIKSTRPACIEAFLRPVGAK